MADCIITPYVAQQIATKDTNRVLGQIARALALNSPFVNVLDGGILPSGVSDTVRSVIQEQALAGDSLVNPTFTATKDVCGPTDLADNVATTEYTYSLATKRGRGPKICVKGAYAAYKGSYLMAEDSLKKLITQYYNADVRYTLLTRSGVKYVVADPASYTFAASLTGGESQIDVAFANIPAASIAQLSFKTLHKIARYMHEVLLVEGFEEQGGNFHYRFIGGSDIIEQFRAELGVKEVLIALTTGGFKFGEKALTSYSWESNVAYRGIVMGVDQRPLRAETINPATNFPVFIEPQIPVATTNGNAARTNPSWVSARYEVAFLIGKSSFERLVPERFTGEGSFKFSPQLALGELQWHYVIDNDCNAYGDFGWHQYEITRAYRPVRPANVVPILFQRCPQDSGVLSCPATGE
jgi:hypothetical protein